MRVITIPRIPKKNSLDKEQREFLHSELRAVSRSIDLFKSEKEVFSRAPKAVKRAAKVAERYYKAHVNAGRKISNRVDKRADAIRQEILFGTPEKAFAMIEALRVFVRESKT